MCEQCDILELKKKRLIGMLRENPQPCVVCDERQTVAAATWIPDDSRRLAAGGTEDASLIFAFLLCITHAPETPENDRLIQQAILRRVRNNNHLKIQGKDEFYGTNDRTL